MPTGFRSMPVLPCLNVDTASDFYVGKLGFKLANKWQEDEDATTFAIVAIGKITIALQHTPDFQKYHGWSAYLYIDNADEMAQGIAQNGVSLNTDIHETFYGMREFDVIDSEGHVIAFGQDLRSGPDDAGL